MNLHLRSKTKYGLHDDQRALEQAMRASKGIITPLPVVFGGKVIGSVGWNRFSKEIWAGPFNGYDDLINKATSSTPQVFDAWAYKTTGAFTVTANRWYDTWTVADDPDGGTFPGAAATAYVHSTSDPGFIGLGPAPSGGQTKHLTGADLIETSTGAFTYILYDRVLVYNACPITSGLKNMTNTVPATRYAGVGVQIMITEQAVLSGAPSLTALSYTNDASSTVSLKGTPYALTSNQSADSTHAAEIMNQTAPDLMPFLPIAGNEKGVQNILSYTVGSTLTGSICFVLARPIAMLVCPITGQSVQMNWVKGNPNLFQLASDACLALVVRTNTTAGSQVGFNLQVAWG